ncbi:LOW QUALITY PROTEIN: hypothetical protein SETIT_5G260100v2 [Setaria italica]|uniref:F-box domain-containing protein n=1 Tax=Setaria italica TaxID=4555 RepID=A0A368R955_SETIT|nr:LOW QUALITY PROTEIN: hypothetical protein SETIT_5G260100v2 [Setaria italica]
MDDHAGDGVDRISALPVDLLHVILARLRRAQEVTRTAALSRRWRRVLPAGDLSLVDDEPEYRLRQRGDTDMDSLLISMKRGDCPRPDQIDAWIRYGTQRVVGDFYLRVAMGSEEPYLTAVKLPEHGRPGSISLHLSCHGIQFPPAAVARYEALTALSLEDVSFAEDKEGRGLSGFVSSSSCCPRLRTLYMNNIMTMFMEAKSIPERQLVASISSLLLRFPGLRSLRRWRLVDSQERTRRDGPRDTDI